MESIRRERSRRSTEAEAGQKRETILRDASAIRERCKTLAGFIREAWHVVEPARAYVHGWHIDVICAHLEAITNGTFIALGYDNRGIFNVPPGTMKSFIISVFWQAWEWGPRGLSHHRFMSSSHSDRWIKRDTRKTRDIVRSDWFQTLWPTELTREGETSFENTNTGNREGVVYGSLTSGRADRVTIDDPHSTEKAESETQRDTATRITRESLTSRLNDPISSAIVIIMQRLHSLDVSAQALALWPSYFHVMLPMEFEPDRCCHTPLPNPAFPDPKQMRYLPTRQMWLPEDWTPLNEKEQQFSEEFRHARTQTVYRWDPRTKAGELLFEGRFPRSVVDRDKIVMGSHATAGQNQQRPGPREGGLFKRGSFPFVKPSAVPLDCDWVRHWDLAGTKKREGNNPAWTVGLKMGRSRSTKEFFVRNVERDRKEPGPVETLILTTAVQDFAEHGHTLEISLPKDPGQAGKAQVVRLVSMLAGYIVHAEPETGSKIVRAGPVAAQAEAGLVKIVINEDGTIPKWVEPFLAELELAPAGFMDQVDALSGAFTRFSLRPSGTVRTAQVTSNR